MKKAIMFFIAVLMAATLSSCMNGIEQVESGINSVISQKVAGNFEPGKVDGDIYINEYMNIKMGLPKGYYFLSEDEIKDVFGVSELYEEGGLVAYDAFMRNDEGASANVVYQLSAVSAEAYLDMIVGEFTLGNVGGKLELCEKSSVKIGGNDIPCVNIEITQEDYEGDNFTMYETIVVKEKEGWIGVITVGSINSGDIDKVISKIEF